MFTFTFAQKGAAQFKLTTDSVKALKEEGMQPFDLTKSDFPTKLSKFLSDSTSDEFLGVIDSNSGEISLRENFGFYQGQYLFSVAPLADAQKIAERITKQFPERKKLGFVIEKGPKNNFTVSPALSYHDDFALKAFLDNYKKALLTIEKAANHQTDWNQQGWKKDLSLDPGIICDRFEVWYTDDPNWDMNENDFADEDEYNRERIQHRTEHSGVRNYTFPTSETVERIKEQYPDMQIYYPTPPTPKGIKEGPADFAEAFTSVLNKKFNL